MSTAQAFSNTDTLFGRGRKQDLFVTAKAIAPSDYKLRGAGLAMRYGFHDTAFGLALVVVTDQGLCGLGFAEDSEEGRQEAMLDMTRRWPLATFTQDAEETWAYAQRVFNPEEWVEANPLKLVLIGTEFEIRVWRRLLEIPVGQTTSYSTIAHDLGKPTASRAVGAAVGRNPISFVVPCHRVLAKNGGLCGYHWGLDRKRRMLGWEAELIGYAT